MGYVDFPESLKLATVVLNTLRRWNYLVANFDIKCILLL